MRTREALPGFRFEADSFAANGSLLFLQWTTHAMLAAGELRFSGVDRLRSSGGRISEEVVYFDTLELWSAIDPSITRAALLAAFGRASRSSTAADAKSGAAVA